MSNDKHTSADMARSDLASRLGVTPDDVQVVSVEDREFANSALGAPVAGEMSAMMISSGRAITLEAEGTRYEYRADKYQLRLFNFGGENFVIE